VGEGGEGEYDALCGPAGADQFVSLLGPHAAAAGEYPRRADTTVIAIPAQDGGVAVGGQRDRMALRSFAGRVVADQLAPLLGPYSAAAAEYPRRASVDVVAPSAHEGGVSVGGERNRDALVGWASSPAHPEQLGSLLGPYAPTAGKHPGRAFSPGVGSPSHDSGVAVRRQCNGEALVGTANRIVANQLAPLLSP